VTYSSQSDNYNDYDNNKDYDKTITATYSSHSDNDNNDDDYNDYDDNKDYDKTITATYSSQGAQSPDDRPGAMTSATDDGRGKQPAATSRGVNMAAKNRRRLVTSSVTSQSADDADTIDKSEKPTEHCDTVCSQ